jgi:hypothetical protein
MPGEGSGEHGVGTAALGSRRFLREGTEIPPSLWPRTKSAGGWHFRETTSAYDPRMAQTYQDFAAQNLALFGWEMATDQIPDFDTSKRVMNGIIAWFNSNPEQTRRILDDSNISDGLWNQGFFTEWPALYHCFAQSTVGWFASTYDDLVACLERAHNAVGEQPSDPISNIHDVVGDDQGNPL